jgi:hypothetical protein
MKVNNITLIKAIVQLMDNGGRVGDELYAGVATDKEERIFLISDYNYPVNITVDDKGEITFTNKRLKGAVKFEPGHDLPVKDAFAIYCEKMGLINPLFFHCNMMEKAIIMASFNNMIRQYDAKGGNVSGEELISSALAATMTTVDQAIKQVDPDMLSDEDSLVQAMIAAGMTPVRVATQEEASAETSNVEQVRKEETITKVTPAPVVTAEEDLERSERLIRTLRSAGELNEPETEILEHLESLVSYKRERQTRLDHMRKDRSNLFSMMRATLLTGPGIPLGLHRLYVA